MTNSETKIKSLRIGEEMQDAIDEIRESMKLRNEAEVFRVAIGTQRRIAKALKNGDKIYVADEDGKNVRELVFINP